MKRGPLLVGDCGSREAERAINRQNHRLVLDQPSPLPLIEKIRVWFWINHLFCEIVHLLREVNHLVCQSLCDHQYAKQRDLHLLCISQMIVSIYATTDEANNAIHSLPILTPINALSTILHGFHRPSTLSGIPYNSQPFTARRPEGANAKT